MSKYLFGDWHLYYYKLNPVWIYRQIKEYLEYEWEIYKDEHKVKVECPIDEADIIEEVEVNAEGKCIEDVANEGEEDEQP